MKICFLAPANSIHSQRWVKFFADRDHEVHWISLYPGELEPLANTKDYFPKTKAGNGLGMLSRILAVKQQVQNIAPDVLHVHSAAAFGLAGALANWRPTVVTAWGSDVLITGKKFYLRPIIKRTLKKADLITCDALHMIDAIQSYGVRREKIHQINFGIDTDRFKPGARSNDWRKEMHLEDAPTVISLRTFHPVYDIESLIRAVPEVLADVPNARFIIAGTGPLEPNLKSLAQELQVDSSINFIGRYDNSRLPVYFNGVDVYVSTSLSDAGIAASTAEAMACGVPIVITNSGENDQWLKDGEGGFLVPVSSPKPLAEGIVKLLKDPDMRKRAGEINRQTIMEKNDYFREMEKMEQLYFDLVRNKSS